MNAKPTKHSLTQWTRARHLVTAEGLTIAEAGAEVGIPEGTCKARAAREKWVELRDGIRRYRPEVQELAVEALQAAKKNPTPEAIGAWAVVVKVCPELLGLNVEKNAPPPTLKEMALRTSEALLPFIVAQRPSAEFLGQFQEYLQGFFDTLER